MYISCLPSFSSYFYYHCLECILLIWLVIYFCFIIYLLGVCPCFLSWDQFLCLFILLNFFFCLYCSLERVFMCLCEWGLCGAIGLCWLQRSKWSSMSYLCRWLQLVFLIPLRLSLGGKSPLSLTADHCLPPAPSLPGCGATLRGYGHPQGLSAYIQWVCPCILPFFLGVLLGYRSQLDCFSSLPTWLMTCVSFL